MIKKKYIILSKSKELIVEMWKGINDNYSVYNAATAGLSVATATGFSAALSF